VGCQVNLLIDNNEVLGIEPVDSPANEGFLCVKGRFGFNFIKHPDRLKTPLIRKDGELVEAAWDEALDLVANNIRDIAKEYGPDSLMALSSARCTNEENYLLQKMFRAAIGNNNIDHCARL
jgi:formate dehydrogenase major subunit